jgi:hypothetical protein
MSRNQGPWPSNAFFGLSCDRCSKLFARTDPHHIFWNPYGPYGWTVYCGTCDQELQEDRKRRDDKLRDRNLGL